MFCEDGVIIAADSKSTETATNPNPFMAQSYESKKLFSLGERIVWGLAGSASVAQRVAAAFADEVKSSSGAYLRDAKSVQVRCRSVACKAIKDELGTLTIPPELAMRSGTPPTNSVLLFAGAHDGKPWIGEMTWQGEWTSYDPRGFHAIGSGAAVAYAMYAILEHHGFQKWPLSRARTAVYRIVDDSIRVSAGGLGPPIRMWVIGKDGANELTPGELSAERDAVELWEQRERECLTSEETD